MILVILNWLYIGMTTFLTGLSISSLFTRFTHIKTKRLITPFFAGLVFVTVYSQAFSLFCGVGLLANGILTAISVLVIFVQHNEITSYFQNMRKEKTKYDYIAATVLLVLFAYGTSRGYIHFDTGLYHAQSIRWVEEYGVVPGLANLHVRFGYNSAAFPLTALYSMAFLIGQSLHTTAGYIALLSAFLALDIKHVWIDKKVCLSDFARIGLIFYLSVIFSQMVSPASDYYAQLLIYDVVILWLDQTERDRASKDEKLYGPYALILFLLVCAVTIKFSVAPMLLLVVLPAALMIREKKWKEIAVSISTGVLILFPFLARNVIICGWLIYPSTAVDLFSVDWKVSKGMAQYDALEIGVYGKGLNDVVKADTPFIQWVVPWFENLKTLEKLWILCSILALLLGVGYLLYQLGRCILKRKNIQQEVFDTDFALVFITVAVSTIFWFVSAPLIRYGYAYITLLPLLCFGHFSLRFVQKRSVNLQKYMRLAFSICLMGFLLTRVKGVTSDIARTWKQDYYMTQEDYPDGEAFTYEIDGVTIYVPTESGQIGYYKFPSSPVIQNIELRGDSLKDGFRQKGESK